MSSEARETEVYEFGPFRLYAAVRRLEREGAAVTLTAKLFDILLLLVSRRGELVTKGELIAQVWSDRVVEENNLTVSISALRKALGETNDGRRQYIETVPKYGYRFVAQVRRVSNGGGAAPREAAVQPTPAAVRSLAVLPIVNAARDAELDYLADGITEGVINRLSAVPELRVMARSTVFRFKGGVNDPREVGATLGVHAVLVGELRRVGEGLEISSELVDVRDGSQIWGGQYRRRLSGTYALHEEIAREISERLFVKLSPGEGEGLGRSDTEDWEAYHLYLKGRYFWGKRTGNIGHYKKAMRYFEAAIALDKSYAQAYVGLADCFTDLVMWDEIPPAEGYPPAKELLQKALAIDDKLADAHASVASVREFYDWDFEGADESYLRAIGLNPNSALTRRRYATYLARAARWRDALEELRLAQRTDPLPGLIDFKIGRILYYGRQYERAVELCRKTLTINPNIGDPYILIAHALLKLGRADEAVESALRGHELMANSVEALANVGYIYGAVGRRLQAFDVLAELHAMTQHKYVPHHLTALVYAGLGDADATIDRLEMAFREKSIYMAGLGTLPVFDDLRKDERFRGLLRRIGFPPSLSGEHPPRDESRAARALPPDV